LAAATLVGVHGTALAGAAPPGYFRIISKPTWDCLTAQDNSPKRGTPMRMHGCDDVASQFWRWGIEARGENRNWLVNLHSQMCLSPNGGLVRDVQYVEQSDCLQHASYQRWQFFEDNGAHILRVLDSSYALSIHSPIEAHGARAMLYHFPGHRSSDQYWWTFCEPGTEACTPIGGQ
jgi:hypothetical protein